MYNHRLSDGSEVFFFLNIWICILLLIFGFVFESIGDFVDEDSDSVLLFDVPSNLSFPQVELLHTHVLKCKTPKDIVSDVSNLENANSGGPIVNSEDSLDWGSLLWNPSCVGSGQTLSGGTVLNPDKAHL